MAYRHAKLEVCSVEMTYVFQAEDGIRDSVASRGLVDVYKKQHTHTHTHTQHTHTHTHTYIHTHTHTHTHPPTSLLHTSDTAHDTRWIHLATAPHTLTKNSLTPPIPNEISYFP